MGRCDRVAGRKWRLTEIKIEQKVSSWCHQGFDCWLLSSSATLQSGCLKTFFFFLFFSLSSSKVHRELLRDNCLFYLHTWLKFDVRRSRPRIWATRETQQWAERRALVKWTIALETSLCLRGSCHFQGTNTECECCRSWPSSCHESCMKWRFVSCELHTFQSALWKRAPDFWTERGCVNNKDLTVHESHSAVIPWYLCSTSCI